MIAIGTGMIVVTFGWVGATVWIAGFLRSGALSNSQVGWLASGEIGFATVGALAAAVWGVPSRVRTLALAAALIAVLANLVATLPSHSFLFAGRYASGAALGLLNGCLAIAAARQHNPVQAFSVMMGCGFLTGAVCYFSLPLLSGFSSLPMYLLAVLAAMAALTLFLGLSIEDTAAPRPKSVVSPISPAAITACAAYAVYAVGAVSASPYILVIGERLGFTPAALGTAIGLAYLFNLAGPAFTAWLGERLGILRPLIVGASIFAISWVVLVHAPNIAIMCACMSAIGIAGSAVTTYTMRFIDSVDSSRRLVALATTELNVAGAIGAKIGSIVLPLGVTKIGAVVAFFVCCSVTLFALAAYLSSRGSGGDCRHQAGSAGNL
jgi:predicted MFS family arabinose efflux permease